MLPVREGQLLEDGENVGLREVDSHLESVGDRVEVRVTDCVTEAVERGPLAVALEVSVRVTEPLLLLVRLGERVAPLPLPALMEPVMLGVGEAVPRSPLPLGL